MKKIVVLITIIFILLLPLKNCFASPVVIDIDYSISTGFIMSRDKVEIFNEKDIAPGDSFSYDVWVNNLSEYDFYFYLLSITELPQSHDLGAFTFSVYEDSDLIFKKNYQEVVKTYLSKIPADSSKAFILEVKFEPWASNEYQRAEFHMDINFGVEDALIPDPEKPIDPIKPIDPPVEPENPKEPDVPVRPGEKPSPPNIGDIIEDFFKTGQDFKVYYVLLCLLIIAVMIFIILIQRRKENGNKKAKNSNCQEKKK